MIAIAIDSCAIVRIADYLERGDLAEHRESFCCSHHRSPSGFGGVRCNVLERMYLAIHEPSRLSPDASDSRRWGLLFNTLSES
jgi:hypothetical protein